MADDALAAAIAAQQEYDAIEAALAAKRTRATAKLSTKPATTVPTPLLTREGISPEVAKRQGAAYESPEPPMIERLVSGYLDTRRDVIEGVRRGIRTSIIPSAVAGVENMTAAELRDAAVKNVVGNLVLPGAGAVMGPIAAVRSRGYQEGTETLRETAEAQDRGGASTAHAVGEVGGSILADLPAYLLQPEIGGATAARLASRFGSGFLSKVVEFTARNAANVPGDVLAGGIVEFFKSGRAPRAEQLPESAAQAFIARNVLGIVARGVKKLKPEAPQAKRLDVAITDALAAPDSAVPLTPRGEARQSGVASSAAPFDAHAYAVEMTAKREAARGAEEGVSVRKVIGQAKAKVVDSNAPIEDAVRDALRDGAGAPPPPPAVTVKMLLGDTVPQLHGEVKPSKKLLPSQDITNAIDRSIMSDEIATRYIKDSGIVQVIKDAPHIEDFEQYATAKQAITVFYQKWGKYVDEFGGMRRAEYEGSPDVPRVTTGRSSKGIGAMSTRVTETRQRRLAAIYMARFGRDLASDAKMVMAAEAEYGPRAKVLGDFSRNLLDYQVDAGLISRDLADYLKILYPDYVPLKRVFSVLEKEPEFSGIGGSASLSRQTTVRKFKGSQREVESPFEILPTAYRTFAEGERNKAGRLLASYRNWEGNPLQIRELKPNESAAHTFSYLDGGKKRTFATTPEIAAAAKALNVTQLSEVGRILAIPARVLKVGATGLNLAFLAKNPVRDIPTAVINSDAGFRVLRSVGRGIFEAANHGSLYDEIMREGGMFTSFDQFRNPSRETVASIRGERAHGESKARYTVRRASELFRAVEDIVSRGEQATRIAVYDATKAQKMAEGMSEAEARVAAKQASLWTTGPFHRQGEWGRVLRATAPYLNAGIQGQRVTVRAFARRPVATFTKMTATTLLPVAVVTAWNVGLIGPDARKRRNAYASFEDYEKENNIIIVPPDPQKDENGLWNVIKIPLPQSAAKFATLIRRPMEDAAGFDPVRFKEVAQALLGTVSPVSSMQEIGSSVTPQAVRPALEASPNVNRDFFTGREVEPTYMRTKPKRLRAYKTTSGTARILAKVSSLSPLQVQHLIRGYTAGVGMQGLNAVDRVLAAMGVIPEEHIGGEDPLTMMKRGFTKAVPMSEKRREEKSSEK